MKNSYLITVKIYRSHVNITTTIKSKILGVSSEIFSSLLTSSVAFGNLLK